MTGVSTQNAKFLLQNRGNITKINAKTLTFHEHSEENHVCDVAVTRYQVVNCVHVVLQTILHENKAR